MASMTKHVFLFVLAGLSLASIAQGRQSAIRNPQSAIPLQVPFIQNQGQIADSQVLFYARTFGGTVYVSAEGQLVYVLPKSVEREALSVERGARLAVIRETLVDADLTALPTGAERSGAIINSFIGNDPRRWQANIPSFTGVQFGDIYEGISLEVRATGDNVEKIFIVKPGADPARIALRLAGAEGVSITPSGELEAQTVLGPVRFTAPVAYQRSASGERQDVSVVYALEGDQVGFCVGAFDAARPLVIDPLLASTFIGGTSTNVISAMALDTQTNVLMAGYTASTDFPTTNSYDTSYNGGNYDGFIAKFDPQLTNLLAATYLGGAGEDAIMAMVINTNNGNIYVAGYTASTNFPITNATLLYPTYNGGAYDAFVSLINSNLTALTISTYLGGTNVDKAYALALNTNGDVYAAGYTASSNFPTVNPYGATFQSVLKGSNDAFVAKVGALGVASTFVGGNSNDQAFGMAIDTNDFVYLAGVTSSTNFPVTNGCQMTSRGSNDAFVAKLSGALTNMVASTYLGGTNDDAAYGIAVAPFTNTVYVVGYTTSTNYPRNPTNNIIASGYTNEYGGGKDAFLTRLDGALTNLQFSTYLGGAGDDEATAVLASATTNSLRIYVAGYTASTNFPVTANAYNTTANGGRDAFISYWSTGNTLQASTYLGGSTNDTAYAMALQADRFSLFVAGATASTNFPKTLRSYGDNDRTGKTNDYGFVTKLGSGLAYGTINWQVRLSDPEYYDAAMAGSPSLGWDGTVYCGSGSNLYAFDAQGRQRWTCGVTGLLVNDATGTDQEGLGCTPAIATNGTIYVTTDKGALQAISPTGGINWTFSGSGKAFESSPAIGSNGNVYFGTLNNFFYAVRNDGVGLWTNTTLASSIYASPVIATNGTIIVASANPAWLYVLNQTNGSEICSWSMTNVTYSASPSIAPNGRIYIGNGNNLLCFDPTNSPGSSTQIWKTAGPVYVAPTIGSNGMIYVGGGSNLYEFNPNGATGKVWVMDGAIKSSPAIDDGGSILVGSKNTGLYSFNPNGTTNWVLTCDEYVFYSSPLIRRDGTIYMTDEKNLYAIFATAPTVRTNWPTARHDVLRTGNAAFDAAPILKPTGLTVSRGANLNVSWNGNANADYYELFRSQTNVLGAAAFYKTLLTTNCTDTNITPGMVYYYWVRVATPVVMSDFSASSSNGIPPLPPANVIATQGNPTNYIVVTWSNSENANLYYVYSNVVNSTNSAGLAWTTNGNTFANTNVTRGRTYYYWVKAGNGFAGISGFSAGTNGGTPPRPPASITASTNSYLAIDVAWSASDYASSYTVYRNTSDVSNDNVIAYTNGLTFGDTNTTQFQNYYYWVRATNQYGMGEFSVTSAVGFRWMAPPLAVYATKGAYTNQIRVSWKIESTAPTSYLVYRSTTDVSAAAVFQAEIAYSDSSKTNYDDLNITRGAAYYYWVQSKNSYGTSVLSTASDVGGTVPFPPININAGDGASDTQITVTWNVAAYATAYEVYRQDSYDPPSPSATPLGIASATNYADTTARGGQRYYYWIKSTNQFGRSELSGFNSGYRALATPYAVSATSGRTNLSVTWTSSDNASNYELWRGTNNDRSAALMVINAVLTNACDDAEAVPGVLYYYWVRAKTPQFVSDFSSYASGYRVLGQVDIGVSDLVFLPTRMAVVGMPAAVSFRVTNYGVQNMAAPNANVAYNFYISSNSVFGDPDDKWMGGSSLSVPLTVGSSAVVVPPKAVLNSIAVPVVPLGWYYIFVDIQHAAPAKWLDPNLANNTISRNGGVIRIGATQPAGLILVNDYNGDGYTDMAMYQESTGTWQVWFFGSQGFTMAGYGGVGFKAVQGDYDGDGKADLAVYREATGTWEIWLSSADYAMAQADEWGGPGFEPVPADYDGDGRADPAVYQEATGTWRVWLSSASYAMASVQGWGGASFQPVQGDYDGDGKADPAVYQETTGTWRQWRSLWNYALTTTVGLGGTGYRPVAADYDLDGIMDPAVFKASTGSWRIWLSASGYAEADANGWGGAGMVAVPGDFDGDGKADPAVYWDAFGMWRLWLSSASYQQTEILAWPGEGYQPVWP